MARFNIEMFRPLIAKSPEMLKRFKKLIDAKYGNGDGKLNMEGLFDHIKSLSEDEILNIVKLDDDLLHQLQVNGCITPDINIDDIQIMDPHVLIPGSDVLIAHTEHDDIPEDLD